MIPLCLQCSASVNVNTCWLSAEAGNRMDSLEPSSPDVTLPLLNDLGESLSLVSLYSSCGAGASWATTLELIWFQQMVHDHQCIRPGECFEGNFSSHHSSHCGRQPPGCGQGSELHVNILTNSSWHDWVVYCEQDTMCKLMMMSRCLLDSLILGGSHPLVKDFTKN